MTDSEQRKMERRNRQIRNAQRQMRANERTYGKGSALLSRANEQVGRIYDIDTQARISENKQGTDERIQNDGIDRLFQSSPQGGEGGIPDGFAEETLDIVENDNTAGQRIFLTKPI